MRDYYAAMINRTNAYFDLAKSLGEQLNVEKTPVLPDSAKLSGQSQHIHWQDLSETKY
jgi:hypothetical protein